MTFFAEAAVAVVEWLGSAFAAEGAGAAAAAASAEASLYGAAAASGTAAYGTTSTYAAATAASTAATYASYAQIAGAVISGVGTYASARNQAEAAEYNAAMGRSNAELANMQAGAAEAAQRRRAGLILGEQRAAFAQSGVDPSSGTGLLVQTQSVQNAEMDALNARYSGLLQSRGLLAQSELDSRQAGIYRGNALVGLGNAGLAAGGAYLSGQGNYLRYTSRSAFG